MPIGINQLPWLQQTADPIGVISKAAAMRNAEAALALQARAQQQAMERFRAQQAMERYREEQEMLRHQEAEAARQQQLANQVAFKEMEDINRDEDRALRASDIQRKAQTEATRLIGTQKYFDARNRGLSEKEAMAIAGPEMFSGGVGLSNWISQQGALERAKEAALARAIESQRRDQTRIAIERMKEQNKAAEEKRKLEASMPMDALRKRKLEAETKLLEGKLPDTEGALVEAEDELSPSQLRQIITELDALQKKGTRTASVTDEGVVRPYGWLFNASRPETLKQKYQQQLNKLNDKSGKTVAPPVEANGYIIGRKYKGANGEILEYLGGDIDDPASWEGAR